MQKYENTKDVFVCTIYKSATMQNKSAQQWRGDKILPENTAQ